MNPKFPPSAIDPVNKIETSASTSNGDTLPAVNEAARLRDRNATTNGATKIAGNSVVRMATAQPSAAPAA
ncbi:MAG TPA: hypothetical protein VL693_12740 [Vicinamibacterales bacterium]|nr:hypothetical protein [Vicinamibacterales bacterium]